MLPKPLIVTVVVVLRLCPRRTLPDQSHCSSLSCETSGRAVRSLSRPEHSDFTLDPANVDARRMLVGGDSPWTTEQVGRTTPAKATAPTRRLPPPLIAWPVGCRTVQAWLASTNAGWRRPKIDRTWLLGGILYNDGAVHFLGRRVVRTPTPQERLEIGADHPDNLLRELLGKQHDFISSSDRS